MTGDIVHADKVQKFMQIAREFCDDHGLRAVFMLLLDEDDAFFSALDAELPEFERMPKALETLATQMRSDAKRIRSGIGN